MKKLLLTLIFLLLANTANATTYYVCTTAVNPSASDGNAGTSSALPWASLTPVNAAASGSTVNFCGGGVWTATQLNPSNNSQTYGVYNAIANFVGTATVSGSTMTVVSGTGGTIGVGSAVTMTGLPTCNGGGQCPIYVVAGSGGVGVYTINVPSTVSIPNATAVTITGVPPQIVGTGAAYALNINSRNTMVISGLTFLNAAYNVGFFQTSFQAVTSASITNCAFGVTSASGSAIPFQFALSGFNMSNVTFQNNLIFGPSYASTSTAQGVYWFHGAQQYQNFTLKGNAFYNLGGIGMQIVGTPEATVVSNSSSPYGFDFNTNYFVNIAGAGAISTNSGLTSTPTQSYIRNNTTVNIGSSNTAAVNTYQVQWNQGTIVTGNNDTNVFTNAPDGDIVEVDWAYTDPLRLSNNVTVSYNTGTGANSGTVASCVQVVRGTNTTVFNNVCYGSSVGFSNTHAGETGSVFRNNTAYNMTTACGNLDDGGTADPSGPTTWYNNILSTCGLEGFRVANGSTNPTETYNLYYNNSVNINSVGTGGTGPVAINGTSLVSNPNFVNTTANNFNLLSSSPAIASGYRYIGNYQYLNTNDITGFTTNAPKPDIGAYYWQP